MTLKRNTTDLFYLQYSLLYRVTTNLGTMGRFWIVRMKEKFFERNVGQGTGSRRRFHARLNSEASRKEAEK